MSELRDLASATRESSRLIEAARRGDSHAEQRLIHRYEPLVRRVIWRLRLPAHCEREDLAQEARMGLVLAIRAWRPERGPFPAFAERCVTNRTLQALDTMWRRKHQILSHAVSLEARTHPGHAGADDTTPCLLDVLAAPRDARTDPEHWLLVREQLTSVLRAVPQLTVTERAALVSVLNGESHDQLGASLGRTRKGASQVTYRARRKLTAALRDAA